MRASLTLTVLLTSRRFFTELDQYSHCLYLPKREREKKHEDTKTSE
jgi:hypothetical protein